jgi:nitrate reductase beta subunit
MRYRVALPLHPEFRTLPMVWYVPPLSPVVNGLEEGGYEADPDDVFPAIDHLRIPITYLANLLTAGDEEVIRGVLKRLAAVRLHMRRTEITHTGADDDALASTVGMTRTDLTDLYRLLAIARYEDRYVIPQAHTELATHLLEQQGACGLDFEGGPGNCGMVPPKRSPRKVDNSRFMLLPMAQQGAPAGSNGAPAPAGDGAAGGSQPQGDAGPRSSDAGT